MKTRLEKIAIARRAAAQGLILLKNDGGALPLARDREVVLMGVTSYFCHRMGFGSGDMLAQRTVQYDEGLTNAGVRLFQPVADQPTRSCYPWIANFREGEPVTVRFERRRIGDTMMGYTYYLNEQHDGTFGKMVTGTQTINGVTYTFNADGVKQ